MAERARYHVATAVRPNGGAGRAWTGRRSSGTVLGRLTGPV